MKNFSIVLLLALNYLHFNIIECVNIAAEHSTTMAAIYSNKQWISINDEVIHNDKSNELSFLKPFPPSDNSYESPTTEIYISIANFMDGNRCAKTIDNFIKKAKYPKRLNFGIIEQIDTENEDAEGPILLEGCVNAYCTLKGITPSSKECKFQNIKSVVYSRRLSRGLSHARATAEENLMANEEFCLQADSHIDLIPEWDVALLNMWGMVQNEYAIISTQPTAMSLLGKNINERWEVSHQCEFDWSEEGLLTNAKLTASAINLEKPILSPTWTSKFSFSKCHAHKKTPEDPKIVRLDRGVTDIVKFARLWTRGYDVYSPHRPIVSHDGKTLEGADSWKYFGSSEEVKKKEFQDSISRVRSVLGMEGGGKDLKTLLGIGRYGLGTKRSLDQLMAFIGVDFRHGIIYDSRCRLLSFVPFEFENNPHVESKDLWGYAPERSLRMSIPLISKAEPIISDIKDQQKSVIRMTYGQETKLPWVFSWIDLGVENFITDLMFENYDEQEAMDILKVVLLVIPVVAVLMTASLWALMSAGDDMRPAVKNDIKIV